MTPAAALLLLVGAPAFAEDALKEKAAAIKAKPVSGAPLTEKAEKGAAVLAGDRDGDGVLSKKEARQLRRAERRARRRALGLPDEPEDADEDAAAAEEASQRSSAASAKAAGAASSLKAMMTPEEAGGGGGVGGAGSPRPGGMNDGRSASAAVVDGAATPEGAAGAAGAMGKGSAWSRSAHTAGASGDPASPSAPSDFVLAARGGYAPAFAKSGLKLSQDGRSITRLDGSPASAADYARLGAEIRAMPAAVGRRADFFSVVSPERYAGVKRGIKERPELSQTSLKDAGLTPDERDIVHTRSCSKVEGGCNESVEKGSYAKGDFIAPEDLDRMWEAMEKELAADAEGGGSGLGANLERAAREKAVEAAASLAGDSPRETNARRAAGTPAGAASSAVAGLAATADRAARRVFRAFGLAAPETGPGGTGRSPVLPLAAAGLAVAILAAAAWTRRGRGSSPEE